ncbi:ribonuclease H-like domain-containing protein [Tanacetum coccineum]
MSGPDTTVELLVKLLGLLGLSDHSNLSSSNTNASKLNFVSHDNPTVYHTSIGPGPHNYVPTTPSLGPIPYYTLPTQPQGPIALPVQYVGLAHPHVASQMVIPTQQPMYPTGPFQTFTTPTSGSAGQKTTLPHAFAAGTLHDSTTDAWNMDTGASSHLNNSVTSLSIIFNSCIFSVKDFLTRPVLLRCDSTGDLYPVISPSPIPHAFLVSQHTWHQRLGHPRGEVLRRLVSSNFISCNKEKPSVLCHACQLGKHMKLPLVSSDTVISSCFDIMHSDVWTSPISLSGFKYYVLFLDHYSQFVWVHPLVNKSDVMSKFMLFRNYVRTQFKCEIKSFQCDHGGEFNNGRLHTLFAENGIQFRFLCPQTSQQNGNSKQMVRTINNLIRTLLFQANLPLTFWVETLNMAIQLLNILPSTAIANDIPYNRLYGKDPNYTLLRIFRTNRPTERLNLHVSSISPLPKSYHDAFNDPNWQNAMRDEYTALIKNKTWTLVPRPLDTNIVHCMWLFYHKYLADGTLSRYKACLVANGSTQLEGVDVDETFSQNAFLHGDLSEIVYMHQPLRFRDSAHPDYVYLLQRSLYGLKQAPRAWFQRFASYITRTSFSHSRCDSSLFIYRQGIDTAYLLLYVDDIVLTASSKGLFLSQKKYAIEILEKAHMVSCNPSRTPVDTESKLGVDGDPVSDPTLYRSLAGSLQHLTFTRPDISYTIQQVCLHMHDPREPHLSTLKRILRYVQGTLNYGLQLFSSSTTDLVAYSDADWAGCPTTRRSTSGYCVFLGNNLLSWSAKRQPTLSRSSTEAEYRGVANAIAETCWLRNLLRELHNPLSSAMLVYCDNVSAVYLSSNPVHHQRTKHIEIDIHFVLDLVAAGQVRVLHVPSCYQFADIFTKGLPSALFEEFRTSLSVRCPPTLTVGECYSNILSPSEAAAVPLMEEEIKKKKNKKMWERIRRKKNRHSQDLENNSQDLEKHSQDSQDLEEEAVSSSRPPGPPKIVNDGEAVLKEIQLEDLLETVGMKPVRQAGAKINDIAGDRIYYVCTWPLIDEGVKCNRHESYTDIKRYAKNRICSGIRTLMSKEDLVMGVWRGVMDYLGEDEEVSISVCNEIRYLWESEAKASNCSKLVSLGEKEEEEDGCNQLTSLRILELRIGCELLEKELLNPSMPAMLEKPISKLGPPNFPPSLVDLTLVGRSAEEDDVSSGSQLSHMPPSFLTKLHIWYFGKLESVSMGLQHLTSLQHLKKISRRAHRLKIIKCSCIGKKVIRNSITDIKSVLTLKALKIFCETFHIPDEAHPQLPSPNQTIHEIPTGKIDTITSIYLSYLLLVRPKYLIVSKRHGNDAICYTKPLDSLKNWNDHFFWVDAFACPASFPWNTSKVGINRYYTLDENTYPEFLRDDDEEMDLFSFIWTADPMKVRVGERQPAEDEPKLLETTVGRTVPLLPVAPACAESELDASVDRLFSKDGSGDQGEQNDFASGGQDASVHIVSKAIDIVAEDVVPLQPRQKKKQKTVSDVGEPSHPAKKPRDYHGAPSGPFVAGKSRSVVKRLLVRAVLNVEHKDENHVDSMTGPNLQTIGALQRFVISSDSSHHSGANISKAEVDSIFRSFAPIITTVVTTTVDAAATTKAAPAKPSLFGAGSSSAGRTDPTPGGFSDVSGSDFLIGGIRTIVEPDFDLQKVYVPQWSVTKGSRLDDGSVFRKMLDEFAPPKFFASIRGMEHDKLFTEFNVGAASQVSLSAEVRMRAEYNIKEKRKLKAEAKAAEAIRLCTEASKFEVVEKSLRDEVKSLKEHNAALEKEKCVLDVSVADLTATVKIREQEAADSDTVVTSVKLQNGSLADQVRELETSSAGLQEKVAVASYPMKLVVFNCLNSPEYLSALRAAISKAIEKGMQDGLATGITHGREEVQNVNFSLFAELMSNKDASVEIVMDLLRLDEALAERLALRDVFVSFFEPLSAVALEGTGGTSNVAHDTTTALSVTFASARTIPPVSMDDYEVVYADGQEGIGADGKTGIVADVNPFPNVEDVELNVSE